MPKVIARTRFVVTHWWPPASAVVRQTNGWESEYCFRSHFLDLMPIFSDKIVISQCDSQGKSTHEPRRGCLQKHAIAEMMAPSMLFGCSWTNISNKSWRVEDFFDVLVRGIRADLGGLYLHSISTSMYLFIQFCMWMEASKEVLPLEAKFGVIRSRLRSGQNGNEIYVKFWL